MILKHTYQAFLFKLNELSANAKISKNLIKRTNNNNMVNYEVLLLLCSK